MSQPPQSFRDRVRPWDCPACNMKRISANKGECPRCHEPRYGSTAAPGSKVMSFGERLKESFTPWTCAVCGRPAAANVTVCPQCGAPRAGTPEALAEEMSGQASRTYESEKARNESIAAMARHGWRVVSQDSFQPHAGVGRTLALGVIPAAFFKPPIKFTVIFERVPRD